MANRQGAAPVSGVVMISEDARNSAQVLSAVHIKMNPGEPIPDYEMPPPAHRPVTMIQNRAVNSIQALHVVTIDMTGSKPVRAVTPLPAANDARALTGSTDEE